MSGSDQFTPQLVVTGRCAGSVPPRPGQIASRALCSGHRRLRSFLWLLLLASNPTPNSTGPAEMPPTASPAAANRSGNRGATTLGGAAPRFPVRQPAETRCHHEEEDTDTGKNVRPTFSIGCLRRSQLKPPGGNMSTEEIRTIRHPLGCYLNCGTESFLVEQYYPIERKKVVKPSLRVHVNTL